MKMNWHDELINRGFASLDSTTRTYGNGKFTGSVVCEKDGKVLDPDYEPKYVSGKIVTDHKYYPDDAKEIFCPFLKELHDERSKARVNSVRIRTVEELDEYIKHNPNIEVNFDLRVNK